MYIMNLWLLLLRSLWSCIVEQSVFQTAESCVTFSSQILLISILCPLPRHVLYYSKSCVLSITFLIHVNVAIFCFIITAYMDTDGGLLRIMIERHSSVY